MLNKITCFFIDVVMDILPPIFLLVFVKGFLTNDEIELWQGIALTSITIIGQILLDKSTEMENEED